jgi:glycosyltransferase involved in cell wall biosynthesis
VRIALLHFHLKTGGVTSVIKDQVKALQGHGHAVVVLSGALPEHDFPAPVIHIPHLAYDAEIEGSPDVESITDDILTALSRLWTRGADIVHVHNPTLAKNRNLQVVLKLLKRNGQRLLCQVHDLAEDGRPHLFFPEPYVADCHYATINPRDHALLIKAGLKPEACHLLPNAVSIEPNQRLQIDPNAMVLYPVRGIRRKNIGEAILLSLFIQDAAVAVTLPPNSPMDIEQYEQWRETARRHCLNINFNVGLGRDYKRLLASCRYVLTTSINEGFGFTFIQAWASGKVLLGRALPEVCRGFTEQGLRLDHLYEKVLVPLEWLDSEKLNQHHSQTLYRCAEQFGVTITSEEAALAWRSVTANKCIDFGLLSEAFQSEVIEQLVRIESDRKRLALLNPFLADFGPPETSADLIAHNRSVVKRNFNLQDYGNALMDIYARTMSISTRHSINKQILAKAFLTAENFSLLKWWV